MLHDLADDHLEQCRELAAFVLLLFKLVEETSEGLRPALVHLDHLRLYIEKHSINII